MTRTAVLCALALLVTSAPAAAESATVLEPALDAGLPMAAAELAERYVAESLAGAGLELRHRAEGEPCQAPECAGEARARAGADYAAVVLLWAKGGGSEVTGANVILAADAERTFLGWRNFDAGEGLAAGIAAATAAALEALRRGTGPWLTVTGTPAGARVSVDGQAVGQLPYRGPVRPGRHAIGIEAPGHAAEHLQVTLQAGAERALEVELQPAVSPAPAAALDVPAPAPAEPRAWLNTTAGVVLAATAAALVTAGALQLAADGECELEDEIGRCARIVDAPDGWALVGSGAGAALLSGATFVWRPLEF